MGYEYQTYFGNQLKYTEEKRNVVVRGEVKGIN